MTRFERLRHTLVFGREDAPVFEALHKRVDVVDLVGLTKIPETGIVTGLIPVTKG